MELTNTEREIIGQVLNARAVRLRDDAKQFQSIASNAKSSGLAANANDSLAGICDELEVINNLLQGKFNS